MYCLLMTKNKAKRIANNKLHTLGLTFWDSIPCNEIQEILDEVGFGTDLETTDDVMAGIYCGPKGEQHTKIGEKMGFHMTWYRFETTGRYEIVAYVS